METATGGPVLTMSSIKNSIANGESKNMTTFPMSSALHLAISTNCELFVRKLLQEGAADANEALKVECVSDYYHDRTSVSPSESIFRHDDTVQYQVFPIHVAMMNCYSNCRRSATTQRERALGIVKALLEYNADPTAACYGVHFVGLGEQEFGTYVASAETGKAFNLIASLKEYPLKGHADDCRDMMDDLTALLLDDTNNDKELGGVVVPSAVKAIWAHLLHHDTFNDFTFQCQDGTEFPAHKCVLAAASDFFATAFEGPWKESEQEGRWPTTKAPAVIRLFLTFIYTGEFDVTSFNEFSKEALELAFEFHVLPFQEICERHCAKHLNVEKVRGLLILATMYDAHTLKKACFEFVELNWRTVMFDPTVLSLSKEHPEIWHELARHCSPTE